MLISLLVGDWGGDGHEKSESFLVESNLSAEQIEEAYQKGSKILGFDFREWVGADYGDRELDDAHKASLIKHKCMGKKETYGWDIELHIRIFLNIVKLGNNAFHYMFSQIPTIVVGGYGLFE